MESQRLRRPRRRDSQLVAVDRDGEGNMVAHDGASSVGGGKAASQIEQDFQRIFEALDSMDTESAKTCLKELQSKLQNTNGCSSRSKGGWKYNSICILDAVLLADNLRPLSSETDLLPEVVKQRGAQVGFGRNSDSVQ